MVELVDGQQQPERCFATIRNVNSFIENVPAANLTEEKKKLYLGEAMFIRAYDYFALVKNAMAGVPLIRKVQTFTGSNLDEMQVPREMLKRKFTISSLHSSTAQRC